jgi:type III secretion protein J
MLAILSTNGIAARRLQGDGNTLRLMVPQNDLGRAAAVLKSAGYPKNTYKTVAEMFPGDGLVVTPFEQRARLSYALGQELSQTMMMVEGVVQARVHVVVPEGDPRHGQNRPSASVVLHHRPSLDVADLTQRARLIVTNAVPGLNSKDVTVSAIVPDSGREFSRQTEESSASYGATSQLSSRAPGSALAWLIMAAGLCCIAFAGLMTFKKKERDTV